jgi:uncharacterized membrane protein YkvA (DUF1232 family)
MWQRLKSWAAAIRRETLALAIACRDPRTPWPARAVAVLVVAYALSPIDLIPDFIPVLGLLDELVLLPAGIWLAMRLIPPEVWADARRRAAERIEADRQSSGRWVAAAIIVLLWLAAGLAATLWILRN